MANPTDKELREAAERVLVQRHHVSPPSQFKADVALLAAHALRPATAQQAA